jgi:hypothetical protein
MKMAGRRKSLGELLIAKGVINDEQLKEALAQQQKTKNTPLGQILAALGYVDRLTLYRVLAGQMELEYAGSDLQALKEKGQKNLARKFSPAELNKKLFFPLAQEKDELLLLTSNPQDEEVDLLIKKRLNPFKVKKIIASELDITWLVDWAFKEEILGEAVSGLFYRRPEESATRVFTPWQVAFGFGCASFFLYWMARDLLSTLAFLMGAVNVFYLVTVLFKFLLSMVGAKYEREGLVSDEEVAALKEEELPVYTILLPVFKEPEVLPKLVEALKKLDYPQEKLDILLLLEEVDEVTREAAKKSRPPANFRFINIPKSHPQTKPKACNYGLVFARGEYLTIYDAEDIPEPDQLKKAVAAFKKYPPDYICFQAALNYFNRDENFLTKMFTLEYSYWYDYMLTGLDRLGLPLPLGGTSNHFRLDKLRELGGWDPFNVTEDADLGIRAYGRGYRVGVLNSTTYEEANKAVKSWISQRSRWQKGYAQTFLVHTRNPFRFLRAVGLKGFFTLQVFIGGSVFGNFVAPFLWTLFIYWVLTRTTAVDPLFPGAVLYIGIFNLLMGNFLGVYLSMLAVFKRKYYHLTVYALANPLYWWLGSVASWKAVWQLFTRPFYWEKTAHGLTKEVAQIELGQELKEELPAY